MAQDQRQRPGANLQPEEYDQRRTLFAPRNRLGAGDREQLLGLRKAWTFTCVTATRTGLRSGV
jgi:hypothetical protein